MSPPVSDLGHSGTLGHLGDIAARAVQLLALAAAPPFFSPAPPAESTTFGTIVSAALLVAVVIGAGRLRVRPGGARGSAPRC